MKNIILTIATFCALNNAAKAASMEPLTDTTKALKIAEKPAAKHWYESLQMRGYTQVRYNRLGETNPNLKCEQCDRYWGNNQGVGIRRARLIISGQVHPRVYLYFQTDAANTVGTGMQFLQVRDLYFDYGLDKKNEFRLRFGQSKVPFGFENLQSSQNRLPLDRADATNSAVANERDMGLFFMWAPSKTRKLYADLIKENLKGSGDYGVFAFGFYNGQVANKPELNNNRHVVARFSYPIAIGKQLIEPGIAAYKGVFTLASD
ncbi:MAG: porin, partial [Bacteroidota bacterium]